MSQNNFKPVVSQKIPNSQVELLTKALDCLEQITKIVGETKTSNSELFDITTLKALFSEGEVVVHIPMDMYENFTAYAGVDFPEYIDSANVPSPAMHEKIDSLKRYLDAGGRTVDVTKVEGKHPAFTGRVQDRLIVESDNNFYLSVADSNDTVFYVAIEHIALS